MTDAERAMWRMLRDRQVSGLKFRRQHPFDHYILDFVCLENRLVIEIDGGQHAEQLDYDETRSKYLAAAGFRIVRFWNNDVLQNLDAVKERIWVITLKLQPHPHPGPPLEGEGEEHRRR